MTHQARYSAGQTSDASIMATRSSSRRHEATHLFRDWAPSTSQGSSGNLDDTLAYQDLSKVQIKRSLSQEGTETLSAQSAPIFQTISFPKRDSCSSISLGKTVKEDGGEVFKNGKRVPPSKRPGVSHAKKTPPNHIKRPRNAYIIFRSHTVSQKLIPKEIEHDHRNISRIIAHMWKSLDPVDRAHYEQIAKEEKEKHKSLYPDYRYQPTTRRTNVSKRNVKKLENGEEECQEIADIILKAQGKEGVVIRPKPTKAMKRVRDASQSGHQSDSEGMTPRKRAKKQPTPESDQTASGQRLATVFLHPSPSASPSSASSGSVGAFQMPSPEPFRLASQTPPQDGGAAAASAVPSPMPVDLLGRRASSVPLLGPCSPPIPFGLVTQPLVGHEISSEAVQYGLSTEVSHAHVGFSDETVMPAPTWKSRKPLPAPITNTWQHCSYDDQSLPSPRSFDAFAMSAKQAMVRPRTAMPSTPSSGTFRGFFHPWAYEDGTESMLVSPMNGSFQELRRRSSLMRSGLVANRRPGSFIFDSSNNTVPRADLAEDSHSAAAESSMSDVQLFDQAAQAAVISLDSEMPASELEGANTFAFDPALEHEGGGPVPSSQPLGLSHSSQVSDQLSTSSPRPSFSGSTLAAAARDWASMKRRQSKPEARSVIQPIGEMPAPSTDCTAHALSQSHSTQPMTKSSLEESIQRAVTLALGKEAGHIANSGDRNNKIVQQILSSLNAELSLQPPLPVEAEPSLVHAGSSRTSFSRASERPITTSQGADSGRRSSMRAPFYPADGNRVQKPLPSPLQLVMSNHREMVSEPYSHNHASSQHCN